MTDALLEGDGVRVTRTMLTVGEASYPLKNISSFRLHTQEPQIAGYVVGGMIICGVGMMATCGAEKNPVQWVLVVCFGVVGIAVIAAGAKQRAVHTLVIGTSGGEVTALRSPDKAWVEKVRGALTTATAMS